MERHTIYLAAYPLLLAGIGMASTASAAGVSAGTDIENTATATYRSGADTRTVDSNTVSVLVDELLDVTLASNNGSPVAVDSVNAALSFTITNLGNGPEAFDLTADASVAGNAIDATVVGIAFDTDSNGVFDQGIDDVLLGDSRTTPSIDADDTMTVFVVVSAPSGAADGESSLLRLGATASTGSGTPGTAFAGQGTGGGDAVVGGTGAQATADGGIVVSLPTVSLVKSAAILDPFGGHEAVPGAIVTYSIVGAVNGNGSVADLTVADAIPAGTTYRAGTLRLEGAALTDAADADAGQASSTGVSVAIGTLASGASRTVSFEATID